MKPGNEHPRLSPDEFVRYQRQMILDGWGEAGQEKLKRARVLVAGVGGLGSPAALYLAAAGVGNLRIVDCDTIELSNLNRQILHWTADVGVPKVDSASRKLRELNPLTKLEVFNKRITQENVRDLVNGCDVVVDAMDNLPARYLLNQAILEKGIPFCHGAIHGYEGRAMTVIPGQSACLMCLYQGASVTGKAPAIGVTAGIIACIEATEAIKCITGMGELLTNRFLIYDGLNMRFDEIRVSRNPTCEHCGDC